MTSESKVRIAVPADHNEIWRLFLMGHQENAMFPLAPEKVEFFLVRCLHHDQIRPDDPGPRGIIGVIGEIGKLEALVFVTIGTFWYTNAKNIEEFIVYVDPEHRKSGHAKALVQWMKDQVEITGLPLMTGIISNHRTEAKCRLYRRMLPKVGEFFFLAPKGASVVMASS